MLNSNPAAPLPSRMGLCVVLLLVFATWETSHSYQGLFSDALLYTLQALAHVHPESLTHDVFLKFGSQDSFTLFSPVYAAAVSMFGIDRGAAILTLLMQFSLIVGACALARSVLPFSMGLAGVAVLIAIPGDYGADRIFNCIESFLTPRMAAEALVLAGLAATLKSRQKLAAAFIASALFVHPVMGAAGVAALLCLHVALPRPRWAAVLTVMGLMVIAIWAFAMPEGRWGRFDDRWLTLIKHRSPYLFLSAWGLNDWSSAAASIATLLMGSLVLPNRQARHLAAAVATTVLGGFALTLIACDWLHLVLFTQAQPWRWQWLGTVVAALLLPETLWTLWTRDVAGRAGAMLLVAAWIFGPSTYGLAAGAASFIAATQMHRLKPNEARWIEYGAVGLLLIAVLWRLASNLQFTDATYMEPTVPLWLRRLTSFAHDGSAPLAVIGLTWMLACRPRGRWILTGIGGASIGLCAILLPHTWQNWSKREFPPSLLQRFSALREHIPPGADVFWPELPLAAWILLDRPSYLSMTQTSGMVFSRPSALELERRADELAAIISPRQFLEWSAAGPAAGSSISQLTQICDLGTVRFLVTSANLGREPEASVSSLTGPDTKRIRLYRCPTAPAGTGPKT
jgi:hypothetical protein